MKVVQLINNTGQTNGQAVVWDADTNEVTTPQWAWPASTNRTRIVDRVRRGGDVIGVRFRQRESDGNRFLDEQYVAAAGDAPGPIELTTPPTDTVPYYDGLFGWPGGDKMWSVVDRLSQYAVYDFAGSVTYAVGTLGSFPYDVGGLSGMNYADGSLRLISTDDSLGMMYLSTPLDGSPLNTAVSLAYALAVAPEATTIESLTAGCVQLLRLLAAGPGTPTGGPAWRMYNYGADGTWTYMMDDQSSFAPNPTGDSTIQFIESGSGQNVATTLAVSVSGDVVVASELTVPPALDLSMFTRWHIIGDVGAPQPPVVGPFWTLFNRTLETR